MARSRCYYLTLRSPFFSPLTPLSSTFLELCWIKCVVFWSKLFTLRILVCSTIRFSPRKNLNEGAGFSFRSSDQYPKISCYQSSSQTTDNPIFLWCRANGTIPIHIALPSPVSIFIFTSSLENSRVNHESPEDRTTCLILLEWRSQGSCDPNSSLAPRRPTIEEVTPFSDVTLSSLPCGPVDRASLF